MQNNNKLVIPVSIVIAGLLIGGAVIYNKSGPTKDDSKKVETPQTVNIKPVTAADHVLGNPNAKILAVEYSDTECPFCKTFTKTMEKVIDNYGKDGTVAWVYRQFPIAGLHPKAPKESEATECVNQIAGNDVFWKYLKNLYEITPSNNQLDPEQLLTSATQFGVDKKALKKCLDDNTFTNQIQSDVEAAAAAGAKGTPYTVLVAKVPFNNTTAKQISDMFTTAALQYRVSPEQLGYVTADKKVVLSGNLPYELIQQIIAAIVS